VSISSVTLFYLFSAFKGSADADPVSDFKEAADYS
jgi:hypothetical protein